MGLITTLRYSKIDKGYRKGHEEGQRDVSLVCGTPMRNTESRGLAERTEETQKDASRVVEKRFKQGWRKLNLDYGKLR